MKGEVKLKKVMYDERHSSTKNFYYAMFNEWPSKDCSFEERGLLEAMIRSSTKSEDILKFFGIFRAREESNSNLIPEDILAELRQMKAAFGKEILPLYQKRGDYHSLLNKLKAELQGDNAQYLRRLCPTDDEIRVMPPYHKLIADEMLESKLSEKPKLPKSYEKTN